MAVTQHMTPAETGRWKQPSHTWSALEKAAGTLALVNNCMGNALLQGTEAVLTCGPVYSWKNGCCTWKHAQTHCGASEFD